jgi:hypothetical protein
LIENELDQTVTSANYENSRFSSPGCDTVGMGGKRRILLAAFVIAVVGGFAWAILRPGEPVYQGKRLSYWLKAMEEWDGDTNSAVFVSFRVMGTNAIPPLLNVIETGGPPLPKLIAAFNRKQSYFRLPYGTPWNQNVAAAFGLYAMGSNARPALATLTNLLFHTNATISSATALAGIGPDALPSLLWALTNQDLRIRHSAASALGLEQSGSSVVVPALIERLQDKDRTVQYAAVASLGSLHAEPELAVPALIKDFPGNDSLLRMLIAGSLAQFESRAKEAVPVLLGALNDNEEMVRKNAAYALQQIDPAAAAKAGVK